MWGVRHHQSVLHVSTADSQGPEAARAAGKLLWRYACKRNACMALCEGLVALTRSAIAMKIGFRDRNTLFDAVEEQAARPPGGGVVHKLHLGDLRAVHNIIISRSGSMKGVRVRMMVIYEAAGLQSTQLDPACLGHCPFKLQCAVTRMAANGPLCGSGACWASLTCKCICLQCGVAPTVTMSNSRATTTPSTVTHS